MPLSMDPIFAFSNHQEIFCKRFFRCGSSSPPPCGAASLHGRLLVGYRARTHGDEGSADAGFGTVQRICGAGAGRPKDAQGGGKPRTLAEKICRHMQGIAYAGFLRELARSASGAEWTQLRRPENRPWQRRASPSTPWRQCPCPCGSWTCPLPECGSRWREGPAGFIELHWLGLTGDTRKAGARAGRVMPERSVSPCALKPRSALHDPPKRADACPCAPSTAGPGCRTPKPPAGRGNVSFGLWGRVPTRKFRFLFSGPHINFSKIVTVFHRAAAAPRPIFGRTTC